MKKILLALPIILLCGCATLGELQDIHRTGEAKEYISASGVILDDFVKNPYDTMGAVGMGYLLALLRRWYKKKMGSKG
jgi:hypothetical protein